LFAYRVKAATGETMPALPVPLAPQFRDAPGHVRAVPPLGGDGD
jgi:hypothetical protein